jgi:HK97 family phage major capsid protein
MSKDLLIRACGDIFQVGNKQIPKTNFRQLSLDSKALVSDERTIDLSVSSDQPYERWWYYEILDHSPDAVDLSRMNDGAMSLYNHKRDDYVGVIEKAWLDDGKLYNTIRFDTHELAERIVKSINNQILKNVSIGYLVHELLLLKESDEGLDTYKATKWTPFESSFVTVPADASVGVGRQFFDLNHKDKTPNWEELEQRVTNSVIKNLIQESPMGDPAKERLEEIEDETAPSHGAARYVRSEQDIRENERERSEAIFAAGVKYNCAELAQKALKQGWTIAEMRSQILEQGQAQKPIAKSTDTLGLSENQQKSYSFQNAIKAALEKGFSENCLEKEVHEELVKRAKKTRGYEENGNILIPVNDLTVNRELAARGYAEAGRANYQRNQMVGDPLLGGNLVETELLADKFVDIFRNHSIMRQMGMQMMPGLVGNVDIPKQIAGAVDGNSVYWVPEDADVSQIDAQFGLVKFRPKNVGSYMYVTRSMLLHSSIGMDNFIRRELAIALALGIDKAAIEGTGTNDQPLGILNTPGVNPIIFGVNGDFPTWERLVQFETKVAVANADERTMGWVVNAKLRGELKSRQKFAGTTGETLWQNAMQSSNQGYLNGYRVGVSNQVRGNYTKGTGTNLSAAIFGDFSRFVCAEWGEYELAADPYFKFLSGGIRVRIIKTCDMAVLQEKAFSVATDVATPFSNAA